MRSRQVKHRLFIAIWLVCAGLAGWLYYHWHVAKDYVGLTEIITHQVGARESGIVGEMLVNIRDHVRSGQIVARLDSSDLDAELDLLRGQLDEALALEDANRDRFAMEIQRLKLQVNNASSDLNERLAEFASRQAEYAGLNAEISRLQTAESAGLGHSRDMADLIVKRDALSSYLATLEKDLAIRKKRAQNTGLPDDETTETGENSMLEAMMAEARERTNDILRDIVITENRKQLRVVTSPCDGHVVDIYARKGDTVEEYLPVLNIMEASSAYLNVYVPERSDFSVHEGMTVDVYPVREDAPDTTGRVDFIHPGYTQVPERLTVRGQVLWAHVVRVSLDPGHRLRPGEIVHVRINGQRNGRSISGNEARAETPDDSLQQYGTGAAADGRIRRPQPVEMEIPAGFAAMTRFEPSGLAWHEKSGKYIVISDDTGLADTETDHTPILFTADASGRVDPHPIRVDGTDTFNDLESITAIDRDTFVLVSSQSASRKGNRPLDRRMLYTVRFEDANVFVRNAVPLLDALQSSLASGVRAESGLTEPVTGDQLPELNIEGAAYRDGSLYLGLKEPVPAAGAVIWRVDDLDALMSGSGNNAGSLSVYGHVGLGGVGDRLRGISDLAFDPEGRLWALSTVPEVEDSIQLGGLHRIDRFADGRLEAVTIFEFPGRKPEGLGFDGDGNYLIVFDNDTDVPLCLTGKVAEL